MEKIRRSGFLKIACYIIIPVLVAILGLSIFHMAFLNEFGKIEEEKQYAETENFANEYLSYFIRKIVACQNQTENDIKLQDSKGKSYYYKEQDVSSNYNTIESCICYIIIDRQTGIFYTNMKSNDYQEEINRIKNQKIYWNLVEGKIDTNLTYINQDNIQYKYSYRNSTDKIENYDVYSFYDEEKTAKATNLLLNKNVYNFMIQHRQLPIYGYVGSFIFLVIIASYLFWAIGYKKGVEGIDLNSFDTIPYEIVSILGGTILTIALNFFVRSFDDTIVFILYSMFYLIGYIVCCVWGITTIKRIKGKTFLKSFLMYKIARWFFRKIKKFMREMNQKASSRKKIFCYYWGFVFISILLASLSTTGVVLIILILFWLVVFYRLRKYGRQQDEIKRALEQIYEGKTDIYLEDEELESVWKEMAIYINDIAGGFSNAIEESLKSERLKTELITNVSHDIKTPLTSIMNYVDLLKKENIQDEKIKEYIQILDRKSQRLKKLTEDLLEASKVSSGNVKLNIEEIKLKELMNQCIGEFRDRFEKKSLKIEVDMPIEEIKMKADNRYMYRVIENLFSNITKYALENSRVYIDIKKETTKIVVSMKNISKDKLNISSDELMQRFVRGDKSRYTEGSGLGLSIAKSLIQLQGGEFEIVIDGDLFKVVIQMPYQY